MVERPCSPASVSDMRGVLADYLRGPEGLVRRLEPRFVHLLDHTAIYVADHAPPQLVQQMGASASDLHLLGVFTNSAGGGKPTIEVFCADVLAVGEDPRNVVDHELGHRFRFDHDRFQARIPLLHDSVTESGRPQLVCAGPHDLAGHPLGADALRLQADDTGDFVLDPISCPVCRLYHRPADAHALMDDLTETASLAAMPAEVPLGLGGTVALARLMIADAQLALEDVAHIWPDRTGELRAIARQLHVCQSRLAGWLDTEGVANTRAPLRQARAMAYQLNHAYWLARKHPHAQARDWYTVAAMR